MTDAMTIGEIEGLSAYALSDMADCESPDSKSSAGARFLTGVRDEVIRLINDQTITLDDFNDDGQLNTVADDAPSIWTAEKWKQFVDLGAYHETPEFDETWPSDLDKAASIALYQIADRLAHRLCEAWRDGWTCPVCGAEVDSGCDDVDGCGNPVGPLVALVTEHLETVAGTDGALDGSHSLPVRTPGATLREDMSVLTGPVELRAPDLVTELVAQAQATYRLMVLRREVARAQLRRRRFRRRLVWSAIMVAALGVVIFLAR